MRATASTPEPNATDIMAQLAAMMASMNVNTAAVEQVCENTATRADVAALRVELLQETRKQISVAVDPARTNWWI